MRTSKPVTVTLGKQQQVLDAKLRSGDFGAASEVVRAALRALEREDQMVNEIMRRKIEDAISDPRPDVPASEVFQKLREKSGIVVNPA